MARTLRAVALSWFGLDTIPGSNIGPGLLLPHPNGIVIGKGTVIGSNVTILQQVTFGEKYISGDSNHGYPVLDDNVTIGAGAKVLGNVRLGEGTTVGANSVVLIDTPARSMVAGSPARVIRINGLPDPIQETPKAKTKFSLPLVDQG
ncbi:MAG: hypothetical protein Q4P05_08800 [Actinomycetaceae bacterium]|nr:hypothetical protein [Actinomycetaceae bacterium]